MWTSEPDLPFFCGVSLPTPLLHLPLHEPVLRRTMMERAQTDAEIDEKYTAVVAGTQGDIWWRGASVNPLPGFITPASPVQSSKVENEGRDSKCAEVVGKWPFLRIVLPKVSLTFFSQFPDVYQQPDGTIRLGGGSSSYSLRHPDFMYFQTESSRKILGWQPRVFTQCHLLQCYSWKMK